MAHHTKLVSLLSFTLLAGCASVVPYQTLTSHLPAEKLLVLQPGEAHSEGDENPHQRPRQKVYVEEEGTGEAVILLHGFGGSSYSWRHLIPALADGYQVLAPDLTGFGFTERPPEREPYTREGQLQLILALMDHHHLAKAHVVGHSYGGALALALAFEYPERVASLTLIDAAAPDYPLQRRKNFAAHHSLAYLLVRGVSLRHWLIRRALKRSIHDDQLVTEELVDAYLSRLAVEGAVQAYQGLTAPLDTLDSGARQVELAQIEQPTLALWGAEDELVPVERARIEVNKMPRAQFVIVNGGGHALIEERPCEVALRIRTFLDSLRGGLDSSQQASTRPHQTGPG